MKRGNLPVAEGQAESRTARLKKIRESFARTVPDTVERIVTRCRALADGTLDADGLDDARRSAHGLVGSGAQFGFAELSASSRALERLLDAVNDPAALGADKREAIMAAVEAVRRCAAEVAEGGGGGTQVTPVIPVTGMPTADAVETAGAKVLVVEDDDNLAAEVCTRLEAAGLQPLRAADGATALGLVTEHAPELILLDVVMPGMDGFQLCHRLRETEAGKDASIIFLTSIETESEMLRAYDLGADDYLTKPFSGPVLVAKIRAVLLRRRREKVVTLADLKKGVVIDGRYRIDRMIGRGGMGVVFLVEHVGMGSKLALKALAQHGLDDEKIRKRFELEVRSLARVRHPHVIRVHDSGSFGQVSYYTMDHLAGGSLWERIQAQPNARYDPLTAMWIVAKVAAGLQCAHEARILHRDLKTDNILFTAEGEPVLTDFSLVLDLRRDAERRMTTEGIMLGTAYYMSPEHVNFPNDLDERSDVYGLGVVLYEMLTGQPPFGADAEMAAIVRICSEEVPSPRRLVPDLPEVVENVCLTALALDRERRFQSASALARAAEQAALALGD